MKAQFHIVANESKREWLHPHRFGDSMLLNQFAYSPAGIAAALTLLMSKRWAGDVVHVIGDGDSLEAYTNAMDSYRDISFEIMETMAQQPGIKPLMEDKVEWRRVRDWGGAASDPAEREFYDRLFGFNSKEKEQDEESPTKD